MRRGNDRTLTDGQIACMNLVAESLTSKEIALRLGISPHTVDQRVRKSLRKLGAPNRRQAARIFEDRARQLGPDGHPEVKCGGKEIEGFFGDWPMPFATAAQPDNRLSLWQRLVWIVVIAGGAMVSAFMYLAGLESLARLLRH